MEAPLSVRLFFARRLLLFRQWPSYSLSTSFRFYLPLREKDCKLGDPEEGMKYLIETRLAVVSVISLPLCLDKIQSPPESTIAFEIARRQEILPSRSLPAKLTDGRLSAVFQ